MASGPRKQRILLTARSACAGWGILEVWRRAAPLGRADIHLVAQEPAATIFRNEGAPFTFLDMPTLLHPTSEESHRLLAWAETALDAFRPDVALVGLSAPNEGGIDEAVIAKAACPTFVLQDFWGDCNLFFGGYADCYLAPDEQGARMTAERHRTGHLVLGSPRHARYAGKSMAEMGRREKTRLGLDPEGAYFGLFCQPLFKFVGYRRTMRDWAQAVRHLGASHVVYRPHPASSADQVSAIVEIIRDAGLAPHLAPGGPIENALAACAVASSVLSNSNMDAAYINHFAEQPTVVPTYMLYEPDLVDYLKEFQELDRIPAVVQGLARAILRREDVMSGLAAATDPATKSSVWRAAQLLPDPIQALERAVDILMRPEAYIS